MYKTVLFLLPFFPGLLFFPQGPGYDAIKVRNQIPNDLNVQGLRPETKSFLNTWGAADWSGKFCIISDLSDPPIKRIIYKIHRKKR